MEINSISSVGAVQKAFEQNAKRAGRISQGVEDPTIEKDMAELSTDKDQVSMQMKTLKTKDQMLGTLLDMLA